MGNRPSKSKKHKLAVHFSHERGVVVFEGLKHDEVDMFLKMLEGAGHIIGDARGTRIKFISRFKELPQTVTDTEMLPFWRRAETSLITRPVQLQFPFMFDSPPREQKVSLYLHDICGYHFTDKAYREAVKLLEHCGFTCLRSKRDIKKGTFTEIWHLPDIEQAKGVLARVLSSHPLVHLKLNKAIEFLNTNVQPKGIDVIM